MIRTLLVAGVVLSCVPGAVFGQSQPPGQPPVEIDLEYAWSELPRRVALFTSIGEAANRGTFLSDYVEPAT